MQRCSLRQDNYFFQERKRRTKDVADSLSSDCIGCNLKPSRMDCLISSTITVESKSCQRWPFHRILLLVAVTAVLCVESEAFSPLNNDSTGIGKPPKPFGSSVATPVDGGTSTKFTGRNGAQTARESAVLVEWERMSELDRRIEDGANYEHFPHELSSSHSKRKCARTTASRKTAGRDGFEIVDGIFCGYKSTNEEYNRLRSADPKQ